MTRFNINQQYIDSTKLAVELVTVQLDECLLFKSFKIVQDRTKSVRTRM